MNPHVHKWHMVDIRGGYIVTEGCHECGARSSFFTTESVPPVDEYMEGRHYWIYQGSYQAVKFSLQCHDCGKRISLDDMVALMLSTCSDMNCAVGRLVRDQGEGSWVYVALCNSSRHETGRCVGDEAIAALNEYFNQFTKGSDKKITIVPCSMCSNLDTCKGIVIADAGLMEIY